MHLSPYISTDGDGLHNIVSDVRYPTVSERGRTLTAMLAGASGDFRMSGPCSPWDATWLLAEQWLFPTAEDAWRASRLRYASIETVSACNQTCRFCPVSHSPRPVTRMDFALFVRIVTELAEISTMEGVFLNHYNEPFLDKRLPQMARLISDAGLKLAINTNASVPFDPRDWLAEQPLIHLLTVNLHTLDRRRYAGERGRDDVDQAVRNIRLYRHHRLAEVVRIVVLGDGDGQHRRDVAQIEAQFASAGIEVMSHLLMDRCGEVPGVEPAADRGDILAGCQQTGSRVLEHLHVLTDGRCVLCCEDYGENHIVGDLRSQSVIEVMRGDALVAHRRRIYGFARCEPGYICRACSYAVPGAELRHY